MERQAALRLTRRYAAPPAEVWAALTEPDSLARWLHPSARLELAPEGSFALGRAVSGRVTQLEPERLLELTWQSRDEEPSVVRFELRPGAGGTVLTLDHSRLDQRTCMAYGRDWTRAFERLDAELAPVRQS
jgi:uncharacterized protein YndB with AHSA1/START domain